MFKLGKLFYEFCQSNNKIKDIIIPRQLIEENFSRSSGAGGQHVNKTNSKAEIRFDIN